MSVSKHSKVIEVGTQVAEGHSHVSAGGISDIEIPRVPGSKACAVVLILNVESLAFLHLQVDELGN